MTKQTEARSMAAMIEKAAANPDVSAEKLHALLQMQRERERDLSEAAFSEAMNHVQKEVGPISADASNPQTRSKYASYAALDKALRPIYTANGFSLSFDTGASPADSVVVVGRLDHVGGSRRNFQIAMPCDGKGAKGNSVMTKTHATMSAVSYGRRALLKMAFNISEGESDDDGNAAGASDKITDEQALDMTAMINELGTTIDVPKFLKYMDVERVEDLSQSKYGQAIAALNAKRKEAAK